MVKKIVSFFLMSITCFGYGEICHSTYFNLEVIMNQITNNTGKGITIEAVGKKKWSEKIKDGQTTIINKEFIPSSYICTGQPLQHIATISAKGTVLAKLWFALIEQPNKKYHIQAIMTDPTGTNKMQYTDIIALDSLRFYEPDTYAKLKETINIKLTGKKMDYGPLPLELRDVGLEITPATHAIEMKPAVQKLEPAKK